MYGRAVGVQGIDLSIAPGECFGFLGPNGAGKTTFIRLALGLIRPTSGAVSVMGHDLGARPDGRARPGGLPPGRARPLRRAHGAPHARRARPAAPPPARAARPAARPARPGGGRPAPAGARVLARHEAEAGARGGAPARPAAGDPGRAHQRPRPGHPGRASSSGSRAARAPGAPCSSPATSWPRSRSCATGWPWSATAGCWSPGPLGDLVRRAHAGAWRCASPSRSTRPATPCAGVGPSQVEGRRHRFSLSGDPAPLLAALARAAGGRRHHRAGEPRGRLPRPLLGRPRRVRTIYALALERAWVRIVLLAIGFALFELVVGLSYASVDQNAIRQARRRPSAGAARPGRERRHRQRDRLRGLRLPAPGGPRAAGRGGDLDGRRPRRARPRTAPPSWCSRARCRPPRWLGAHALAMATGLAVVVAGGYLGGARRVRLGRRPGAGGPGTAGPGPAGRVRAASSPWAA